jgi:bifunctional DNase/RNase
MIIYIRMQNKIDLRTVKVKTHRPITISLKTETIERLENEVAKGSWSMFIDESVNTLLDTYKNNAKPNSKAKLDR